MLEQLGKSAVYKVENVLRSRMVGQFYDFGLWCSSLVSLSRELRQ